MNEWMWIVFLAIVAILLAIDMGIFNRGHSHISVRKALWLSAFWIGLALAFGLFVYVEYGIDGATEYYAAYVVEKAMSVDNIFVFLIIFSYFGIPDEYQHKVLFYGIIGAIAFRFLFIFAGIELINRFQWMMIVFGILLIFLAFKTVIKKEKGNPTDNAIIRFCKRFMKVSDDCDEGKMFTFKDGVKKATPLLLAVIAIESTDLIFALDSVPAVLAITQDVFIAYTSNIFAILGLRSLYFALRGAIASLSCLKYGLGGILGFVGLKMLTSEWYHIDVTTSLIVILSILAITIIVSLFVNKNRRLKPA